MARIVETCTGSLGEQVLHRLSKDLSAPVEVAPEILVKRGKSFYTRTAVAVGEVPNRIVYLCSRHLTGRRLVKGIQSGALRGIPEAEYIANLRFT